jgi:hypothetical protein
LKNWGEDFPNNLPSLNDYPELLKIPGLIIPQDDSQDNASSESDSDSTIIIPQDDSQVDNTSSESESDSDSTIILPHDVDSDDTIVLSE